MQLTIINVYIINKFFVFTEPHSSSSKLSSSMNVRADAEVHIFNQEVHFSIIFVDALFSFQMRHQNCFMLGYRI